MPTSNDSTQVYTVGDWLSGCVNFAVPASALNAIFNEREIDGTTPYSDRATLAIDIRLLKADLLKWIVISPSSISNTSDSDNGWSHSGGGYSISKDDKRLMLTEANAIYEELEPESVFKKPHTTVHSAGIMPAMRDVDGTPLPRIEC